MLCSAVFLHNQCNRYAWQSFIWKVNFLVYSTQFLNMACSRKNVEATQIEYKYETENSPLESPGLLSLPVHIIQVMIKIFSKKLLKQHQVLLFEH